MGMGGGVRGQRFAGDDRLQALERVFGRQLRKNVGGRLPVAPAFPPHQRVGAHAALRQPGLHDLPGSRAELSGRRMANIPHHVAGLGQRIGSARCGRRGYRRRRGARRHRQGRLAWGREHRHRLNGGQLARGREHRLGGRRRRLKRGGGRPCTHFLVGSVAERAGRRGRRCDGRRAGGHVHFGRGHRPTPGPACPPRRSLFLGTATRALGGDLGLRPTVGTDPLPAGLKLLDV